MRNGERDITYNIYSFRAPKKETCELKIQSPGLVGHVPKELVGKPLYRIDGDTLTAPPQVLLGFAVLAYVFV